MLLNDTIQELAEKIAVKNFFFKNLKHLIKIKIIEIFLIFEKKNFYLEFFAKFSIILKCPKKWDS